MNNTNDMVVRLKLLKLLNENPRLTQRQMNDHIGISLGKINYCLSELAKEGFIRIERDQKIEKTARFIYYLTPDGIDEIIKLSVVCLKKRIREYNEIERDIRNLSKDILKIDKDLYNDPEITEDLKRIQR